MSTCRKPYSKKTMNNTQIVAYSSMVSPYSTRSEYTRMESPYSEFCLKDISLKINDSFFLLINNTFKLKI